jgi:hypothetical protein
MTVLLGVDGPGVLDDTSFRLKVNTALYVYWACKCCTLSRFVQESLFKGKYLIRKIFYPYSYLDLNNCWLTMIIVKTFELITCDSHSQEMNFMPYLFVLFYLMSSHREIRLNRTLLRHAKIYFFRFFAFDS